MANRFLDVNGISIEMPEQAAQAFDAMRSAHAKTVEAKDAEIVSLTDKAKSQDAALAKAEARAEAAEAKVKDAEARLTPQALDAAARERATLIEDAKLIAPTLDTKTLDSSAIRREAVKAAGVTVDGKSDEYVVAAFDARVELAREKSGTANKGAEGLATRAKAEDASSARAKYLAERSSAYRMEVSK